MDAFKHCVQIYFQIKIVERLELELPAVIASIMINDPTTKAYCSRKHKIIRTERFMDGTLTVHIKNWLPLVFGPAFAMLTTPGPTWTTA